MCVAKIMFIEKLERPAVWKRAYFVLKSESPHFYFLCIFIRHHVKGGPGASGRVLSSVTRRSRVRVAVSSHCTGEGKACH